MGATILKALMTYVVKPLLIDLAKALFDWGKNSVEKIKRKKETKKKVEKNEAAQSKDDVRDSFGNLP